MGQTVIEKIVQKHTSEGPGRPVRSGDVVSLRPKHVMTHDNTAAVMKKFKSIGARRIWDHRQPVFALDHDVQNDSESNLAKYREIEQFARQHGIDFYPAGTGIGHQIMVSQGYVVPGSLVVASDSHSNMYGAVGALGTPVVRTDAAAIWASGEFWWQIPRTVQVVLEGELPEGVTGKDLIITLCGLYSSGEVLNAAIEFTGSGIGQLGMDARMTIANMTTEWGALAGVFPVDNVTIDYLEKRMAVLGAAGGSRFSREDLDEWRSRPLRADPDASYAARIVVNMEKLSPQVAGPDTVQRVSSVAEIEKKRISVHKAYILSCVNGRLEDLEAAGRVLDGKRVAAGVKLYVAAASKEIQEEAESSGVWGKILGAGAIELPPGCGPCIGLGEGTLAAGEVGISATNRNFKGRMGSREAVVYLASPEVVASSAVAGYICGPGRSEAGSPERSIERFRQTPADPGKVQVLEGFPERIRGRLVFVPQDNLNTDGIYSKDYTYREGMTREEMARVVMENYDPEFARKTREGDILVGGWNFGTGSSREQAATALKAKGIAMVIAASFSQTYLRNAYNNGFVCIECSDLVKDVKERFERSVGEELTIIPGEEVEVDFARGVVAFAGKEYRFPPLGSVPQSLVVAGGIENLIRRRLGLSEQTERK